MLPKQNKYGCSPQLTDWLCGNITPPVYISQSSQEGGNFRADHAADSEENIDFWAAVKTVQQMCILGTRKVFVHILIASVAAQLKLSLTERRSPADRSLSRARWERLESSSLLAGLLRIYTHLAALSSMKRRWAADSEGQSLWLVWVFLPDSCSTRDKQIAKYCMYV